MNMLIYLILANPVVIPEATLANVMEIPETTITFYPDTVMKVSFLKLSTDYRVIFRSSQGGRDSFSVEVVTDSASFAELHAMLESESHDTITSVGFDSVVVLVVSLGTRPTPGHGMQVEHIWITNMAGGGSVHTGHFKKLDVAIQEICPPEDPRNNPSKPVILVTVSRKYFDDGYELRVISKELKPCKEEIDY